ncbi:MAG: putative metal-binding motif-containing protein [Deltaproteobacteria bacterium]|nr:putative metal-binding motif-containing protein [Deltaproteobacteria bacterium]
MPLVASSCESSVSGRAGDAGIDECCLELRCAPGQECFDCRCRESACCAALSCQEDLQVCVNCACVYVEDDPGADGGGGATDGDGDGFDADTDCDDGARAVNPGAAEVCNLVDDDCDGSTDEDSCPGQECCSGECRECCEDAHCDDGDGCTADVCDIGQCRHDRPGGCGECCRDLCEDLHDRGCASVMNGDCGELCSALSAVEDDSGCTGENRDYQACLSACSDVCEAECDDLGDALARCVGNWCASHWTNGNCQTLAGSFNF